jgi:hypothetical protein
MWLCVTPSLVWILAYWIQHECHGDGMSVDFNAFCVFCQHNRC